MTSTSSPKPKSSYTWKDVAAKQPLVIQTYVQEQGPLPDGPVTEESWNKFFNWIQTKAAE